MDLPSLEFGPAHPRASTSHRLVRFRLRRATATVALVQRIVLGASLMHQHSNTGNTTTHTVCPGPHAVLILASAG
jgi:hypothetical protein